MISGDSTASHMGSVKNIDKARERRTFETMPGSTEAGMPDELLAHAESVHPRMGYDMSDSIFMQEMQAAGRDKESRKALEERAALEAFRAAALQKPFDPTTSARQGSKEGTGDASKKDKDATGIKRKADEPPRPIAGIKLKRKSSGSSDPLSPTTAVKSKSLNGKSSLRSDKEAPTPAKGQASPSGGHRAGGIEQAQTQNLDSGRSNSARKKKKICKRSKKTKSSSSRSSHPEQFVGKADGMNSVDDKDDGNVIVGDANDDAGAGALGLGLVAYASGDDSDDGDDSDARNAR